MSAQASIIVCKPQVAFSERRRHANLQKLTVVQLRKRARDQGLDLSRLTEKWEFVHILVEHFEHGAKGHVEYVTDTKRRTFFDLPGELRNKIYGYVLVRGDPFVVCYGHESVYHRLLDFGWLRPIPRNVRQLTCMSWSNRELHKEARSYFFANNSFQVVGDAASRLNSFLGDIREDAVANITSLDLAGDGFGMYRTNLLPLLGTCVNLRHFKVLTPLGHVIATDSYAIIYEYITRKNMAWIEQGQQVELSTRTLMIFTVLPALQTIELQISMPRELSRSDGPDLSWTHRQWCSRGTEAGLTVEQAVSEKFRELFHDRNHIKAEVSIA